MSFRHRPPGGVVFLLPRTRQKLGAIPASSSGRSRPIPNTESTARRPQKVPGLKGRDAVFVLLVDNDVEAMTMLERSLLGGGCDWEIEYASSPADALAIIESRPIEVIVADMHLKGTGGVSLLRDVTKTRPETVRIAVADAGDEELVMRAMNAAHRVIEKPCGNSDLMSAVERVYRVRNLLQSDELRERLGSIEQLPAAPQMFFKLTKALDDPDTDAAKLAALVAQDPAMAAKVLRLCNSAVFSAGKQVNDIRSAVTRLGFKTLRNIALASEVFAGGAKNPGIDPQQLQRRALLASVIAPTLVADRAMAEVAATAALLARVGELLPASALELKTGPGLRAANDADISAPSRAEAGAYLLGLWGLPMSIVEAVAFHQQPRQVDGVRFGLTGAVHIAAALAAGEDLDEEYVEETGMSAKVRTTRGLATALAANG